MIEWFLGKSPLKRINVFYRSVLKLAYKLIFALMASDLGTPKKAVIKIKLA